MIAASDRMGMFTLGVLCGALAVTAAFMVWMTLQEAKYGYAKRRIEHKYRRRPNQLGKHVDPIIRRSHDRH